MIAEDNFPFMREILNAEGPKLTRVEKPVEPLEKGVRMSRTEWHKQRATKVQYFIKFEPRIP